MASESSAIGAGAMRGATVNVKIPSDAPVNVPVSTHLYEPSALGVSIDTHCSMLVENTSVDLEAVTHADVASLYAIAAAYEGLNERGRSADIIRHIPERSRITPLGFLAAAP